MFIITGGGSGIGRALAISLANRGKKVLIIGRREQLLRETMDAAIGATEAHIPGIIGIAIRLHFSIPKWSILQT